MARGATELIVMYKEPDRDLTFVTGHIIMLELAIKSWVNCGHKVVVSNNTEAVAFQ